MSPEYLLFKQAVEKQRKVVIRKQALADKQRELLKTMLATCPHEEVEEKSSYFSGSYYDRATNTTWTQCKLCGERGAEHVEMLSYYG